MRVPALLFALGAASLSSGCVAVGAAAVAGAGMVAVQDRSLGRAIDDTTASGQVKARLMALDAAVYMHVSVETSEGTLLLAGNVPSAEHKAMAERIAWSVGGVDDVANEIEVGRNAGLLRGGLDHLITTEVRAKLLANGMVKGVNYNIETQKGVVYLMGIARSDEELQTAAQAASTVRGVERVVSYVVVRERNARALAAAPTGAAIELRTPTATSYTTASSDRSAPAARSDDLYEPADGAASGSGGAPLPPHGRP